MKVGLIAFLVAFLFAFFSGLLIIPVLKILRLGQSVRSDGPRSHLSKAGTPTMGGIIFILAITAAVVLVGRGQVEVYLALAVTVAYGLVGFADDFIKVALRRSLGLKARYKLIAQIGLGLMMGILAVNLADRGTQLPLFFSGQSLEMGNFYPFFALLVLVATTNGVNLTDGLDGLAAGTTLIAAAAYFFIALWQGQTGLALFAAAVVGGCLGFLFYNRYPARVFMGDTGSLALGGALGSLAILTRTELLLPLIGGVFVIEALSVIIQVLHFRYRGRRIFRMSPLHHHFELIGWPEKKVVKIFWLWGLAFALGGSFCLIILG